MVHHISSRHDWNQKKMSPSSSPSELSVSLPRIEGAIEEGQTTSHSYFIAISGSELTRIERPPCPDENCGSCPCGRHSVLCPRDGSGVHKIIALVELERGLALSVETEREKKWYDIQKTLFPDDLPDRAPPLTRMMARWCFPEMGVPCPMGKGDDDDARRFTFVATLFLCLVDAGLARGVDSEEGSEIRTTVFHIPPAETLRDAMKRAFEAVGIEM